MIDTARLGLLRVALAAGSLALCGPALAQDARADRKDTPPTPAPSSAASPEGRDPGAAPRRGSRSGDAQKVFVVRHVEPARLADLLRVFPAEVRWTSQDGLRAIAVSAHPTVLSVIEETIKRLDQPDDAQNEPRARSVEITAYVVEALAEQTAAEPLPSELEHVTAQLRQTLRYPSYRLLDTLVARGQEGSQFRVQGVSDLGTNPRPAFYTLSAVGVQVLTDGGRPAVRLRGFAFDLQLPIPLVAAGTEKSGSYQYREVGLRSDLTVREGQHVVVGKSGQGDSKGALVLVLTARVTD